MKSAAVITTILLHSLMNSSHGSELKTYEARYEANSMGLSATAYRSLTLGENEIYRLENSLSLTLLGANVGTVVESSEFRWEDDKLTPLQYRYEQTGISDRLEDVHFDWASNSALSTYDDESWTLPLQHTGIVDKLSYSISMGHDIGIRALTEFSYEVVDTDEIETHLYRVTGEEVISTPLGDLNTVKIERVRSPDSTRKTTVWLARDLDYLLVRLEQVNGSGISTELALESVTINGIPITGQQP